MLSDLIKLAAKGFEARRLPCTILSERRRYSVELATQSYIEVDQDEGRDGFGAVRELGGTPACIATRTCRAQARIVGVSSMPGATKGDHRAMAEFLLHKFYAAMHTEAETSWRALSGQWEKSPEDASSATYLLTFEVDVPVEDGEADLVTDAEPLYSNTFVGPNEEVAA